MNARRVWYPVFLPLITRFKLLFRKFLIRLILISTVLMTYDVAAVSWLNGRVVGVHDGDTLTLLTGDNSRVKIRLAGIDAPEKKQPYGQKAKQALSDLVFGHDVAVRVETTDRYGRTIGYVRYSGLDINRTLLEGGHVWAYRRYLPTGSPLLAVEQQARNRRVGLWALSEEQTPPWQWRRGKRTGVPARTITDQRGPEDIPLSVAGDCDSKQFCKQMLSCAEANHYLHQCGLARLDGDGDGVPCESLCRP